MRKTLSVNLARLGLWIESLSLLSMLAELLFVWEKVGFFCLYTDDEMCGSSTSCQWL